MKTERRSNTVRSGEMRARLAQAAYEVIAERGHSAFRTAAVAARAGVSQGALLHHFPTKDAVTLAAIEYALGLAVITSASNLEAASRVHTIEAIAALMIGDFQSFFGSDQFWVALDITMDASKNTEVAPQIKALVGQYRKPIYEQWESRFITMGWTEGHAAQAVLLAAALVGGFAIRSLWNDSAQSKLSIEQIVSLIAAMDVAAKS